MLPALFVLLFLFFSISVFDSAWKHAIVRGAWCVLQLVAFPLLDFNIHSLTPPLTALRLLLPFLPSDLIGAVLSLDLQIVSCLAHPLFAIFRLFV